MYLVIGKTHEGDEHVMSTHETLEEAESRVREWNKDLESSCVGGCAGCCGEYKEFYTTKEK